MSSSGGSHLNVALNLSSQELTDDSPELHEALQLLAGPNSIRSIDLEDNQLGDGAIQRLVAVLEQQPNPTLCNLIASRNELTDLSAISISLLLTKTPSSLLCLSLSHNNLGSKGAQLLAKALRDNAKLVSLSIDDNDIDSVGALAMAEMLSHNDHLQSLVLEGNDIGDSAANAIGDALCVNKSLTSLNLCGCDIGIGAIAIANSLISNSTLKRLNFSHNFSESIGADAFMSALCDNSTLQQLHLAGNNVRLLNKIGDMLRVNSTLQKLSLKGNKIGDVTSLASGLVSASTIQSLDLSDNRIDDRNLVMLLEAVRQNKSLQFLDLRNCPFQRIPNELLDELKQVSPDMQIVLQDDSESEDTFCLWARQSMLIREAIVSDLKTNLT